MRNKWDAIKLVQIKIYLNLTPFKFADAVATKYLFKKKYIFTERGTSWNLKKYLKINFQESCYNNRQSMKIAVINLRRYF